MSSILEDIQDNRKLNALTGLSREEFQELLPVFTESYQEVLYEAYESNKAHRHRQPGGGPKGVLDTMDKKLFFILYYWKVYPTFDVLGDRFGFDRSKACTNVHKLWPVLERALEKKGMLPARSFTSVAELRAAFAGVEDVFIDATEREHTRPCDDEAQQEKYSGKKNDIPSKIRSSRLRVS
jgi:hypothetical protein